jgi:hypothetical protein
MIKTQPGISLIMQYLMSLFPLALFLIIYTENIVTKDHYHRARDIKVPWKILAEPYENKYGMDEEYYFQEGWGWIEFSSFGLIIRNSYNVHFLPPWLIRRIQFSWLVALNSSVLTSFSWRNSTEFVSAMRTPQRVGFWKFSDCLREC